MVWELPQRDLGESLPEWAEPCEQVALYGTIAHLNGARIFETQTYYRRPFAEIVGLLDTVCVSLYRSLRHRADPTPPRWTSRGVRGAVPTTDTATGDIAGVWRQRLGGGIRDAWPPALAHPDDLSVRMVTYHGHAIAITAATNTDGAARVHPDPPQTSWFHVRLPPRSGPAPTFAPSMASGHGGGSARTPIPAGAVSRSASARAPWVPPRARRPA
ncbi:hypothetical protein [Nonomuraea aridisoli]|uniref:Uncharacterized protein n=1 Tax=Nonomuraea aridisoli TaxID=2070368 RepID=A0A2W2E1T6_9ACTN|nr:hypothetical protein [Nonomuraea aridisoli]PZG07480.1 hypothetical protein C1J01_40650 [Nonomuraea aridisoli]